MLFKCVSDELGATRDNVNDYSRVDIQFIVVLVLYRIRWFNLLALADNWSHSQCHNQSSLFFLSLDHFCKQLITIKFIYFLFVLGIGELKESYSSLTDDNALLTASGQAV